MNAPHRFLESGRAEEGREYRVVLAHQDVDAAAGSDDQPRYTGERHDCRWSLWDDNGAKLDEQFSDSQIVVLGRS